MIETVRLPVADGTTMLAYVARHMKLHNAPGIMIYQDAFGVNDHFKEVAVRYAAEGFVAIVPELYHRSGDDTKFAYGDIPGSRPAAGLATPENITHDFRAAYAWLTTEGGVAKDRVACTGFCMGGRVTYMANADLPLAGAVSYYGGNLSVEPYAAMAEQQHSPILMFWAGLDKHLKPEGHRALADLLTAAGKEHTQVVFSHAEHGFFCNDRAEYHPESARESWALTLSYFRNRGLI
jgi:carboxymethylenebutenolidase